MCLGHGSWLMVMLVLSGCGSSTPHPPLSPQATSALARIDVGPPPGRVESIPKQPAGADAWVDGEWIHRHGRWYWLLGRWVKTPEGATYSPWVVVRASDGTPFYAPSVWRDAKGAVMPDPPGLAFASAKGTAVTSPEGNPETTGRAIQTAPPAESHESAQPLKESPSDTP
jgi:hypothetical protein